MEICDFDQLENTVEQYATKGAGDRGWRIDTTVPYSPPGPLTAYPFASQDGVGVRLAMTRGDVTVGADFSSHVKATWRDFLPTFLWKRTYPGTRHELLLRTATAPSLSYRARLPDFIITSETQLLDGLSTKCTATTRISPRNQMGFSFSYDPSRTGLRNYTFAFARQGCASVRGGDIVAKYDAITGPAIHTRIPVNPYAGAVILAEQTRFLVGAEARSPCGAQILLNANLVDSRATLILTRSIASTWKVRMQCSAVLSGPRTTTLSCTKFMPQFGIVFLSNDAP
ncbi:hypothetical protein ERJ75_001352500 [Trypanosoma vivax]|uniref:Uncharacterized protein n=1 Tax=Trypanosoma vivax (strain Y486) TaxID=1055687 RepID=G0UCX4_TRYVY|nr:hypothetical protein TRVL_01364 [Trypanosoma vivax]KAH8608048.1 hypothetical protein ERJ75_001352500 [Trypanosoma vivax]CCC53684.1 conserved hypothetical protein [Trypanosoma vivax Y486]